MITQLRFMTLLVFYSFISFQGLGQNELKCGTDEALKSNPELQKILDKIEKEYQQKKLNQVSITPDMTTIFTIPVVFHVYHLGEAVGTGSNVSDAAIQASVDRLNAAFRATGIHAGLSPDIKIQFVLASKTPNCDPTNGIVRIDGRSISGYTNGVPFADYTMQQALRNLSTWNTNNYVNIRICHIITGAGGFAAYLNDLFMPANSVNTNTNQTGLDNFWAHEMGHSMNLLHTFYGDGTPNGGGTGTVAVCPVNTDPENDGDKISDTAPHKNNDGCDYNAINSCTGNTFGDVLRNIMSYSCTEKFTPKQMERMRYSLINYRSGLINSKGITGITTPPLANSITKCSAGSATLIASGCTGTYNWYATSNGGSSLSTAASYTTPPLNSNTTYYVSCTEANCGVSNRTPAQVIITPSITANACNVTATNGLSIYFGISNFSIGSITYTGSSSNNMGTNYQDNTCTKTDLQIGNSYPFTLTGLYENYMLGNIYIDYNNDGDFDDTNEIAFEGNWQITQTGNIIPPNTATTNTYLRMRVMLDAGEITSCLLGGMAGYGSGLALDFSVKILPSNCTTPATPTTTSANRCGAGSTTLSASNCSGTYNWYSANSGGSSLSSTANFTTPSISTTNTYYVDCTVGSCTSTRTSAISTIKVIPAAPTVSSTTINSGQTATLTATNCGGLVVWYATNTGTYALNTGTTYTTPALTTTTNYYSECLDNGCTSATRTNTTVTIGSCNIVAPTTTSASRCGAGSTTLSASNCSGTYNWYSANSGSSSLGSTANFTTPSISTTNTYYVDCTVGSCISTRTSAIATIKTIPAAPTVSSTTVNSGQTATLTASGCSGTVTWFGESTGAMSLSTGTSYTTWALTNTVTLYADCSINGCISATRGGGNVTVNSCNTLAPSGISASRCDAGTVGLSASGCAGIYNWYLTSSGGTSLATGSNFTTPFITFTSSYFVDCTVGNCTSSRTTVVASISSTPFIASPQSEVCVGLTSTLTAYPAGAVYQWKKNGVIISGETNQTYVATSTGAYSVVVSQGSCPSLESSNSTIVFGNKMSVNMSYSSSFACSGTIIASPSSSVPVGAIYQWLKDGLETSITTSTYNVTQTGYYAIKASIGSCSGVSYNTKLTIGQITASIYVSGNYRSLCGNGIVILNASTNGGSSNTYQWIKNGVDIVGEVSANYNATSEGIYTVRVMSGGCSTVSSKYEVNNQLLQPSISATNGITRICNGSVSLVSNTYTSVGSSFQWYKDGVILAGSTNSNYLATSTGNYTLKVTQGSCSATSAPVPIAVGSLNIPPIYFNCATAILSTATIPTGATIQWYRDSSPIIGATSISCSATISGQYQVAISKGTCIEFSTPYSLTVPCISNFSAFSYVSGLSNICNGDGSLLNASPNGNSYTYQWKKNGVDIIGANYNHFVAKETGNFTVLISNGTSTSISTPLTITVGSLDLPTITGNSSICSGSMTTLSTITSTNLLPTTYQWFFNNSAISGAINSSYLASQTGNYQISTTRGTCITQSANFALSVTTPTVVISPNSGTICNGINLSTNITGFDVIYQWIKDGTDISNANSASYRAMSIGNYAVRITQGNCSATAVGVSITTGTISAFINGNSSNTICTGSSLKLISSSNQSYYTYQWSKNDIAISGATNPSYTATETGVYKITINSLGCVGTATSSLTVVNSLSSPNIGNNLNNICNGASINFIAPFNYTSYQWRKNGVDIVGATGSIYTTSTAGLFDVKIIQGSCNIISTNAAVNTNGIVPIVNTYISTSNTGCNSIYTIYSSNSGNGISYQWQKNGADIIGATNSSYTPTSPQDGNYTLKITQNSCTTISQVIKIAYGVAQTISLNSGYSNCGTNPKNLVAVYQSGYTYQWIKDGSNISGATNSGILVTASGSYQVTSTFNGCSVTSEPFVLSTTACPCLSSYYSSSNIYNGPFTRTVSNDIVSSEILNNFTTNTYDAKKNIILLPGFVTKANAVFTAKIGGCTN